MLMVKCTSSDLISDYLLKMFLLVFHPYSVIYCCIWVFNSKPVAVVLIIFNFPKISFHNHLSIIKDEAQPYFTF